MDKALNPVSSSGVSLKSVERAINALLKWRAAKSKTQKPQLLEQEELVYLILTLKKIPQKGVSRTNAHKIPLPHALINPNLSLNEELCLIIDDRPKSGVTKDAVKKKIDNDSIPICKIIKLSKLKSDYRPFEAKRKLCDSYDMFFADRRVIPLLPKLLGKQFFKKKKIPVALDLKHKNWKEQIDKACGSALLYLRTGTCSVVKVGRLSMDREHIVANVMAAINGIAQIVPRNWGGIRSFHLKLLESLALPLYQAVPDLKLKIEGGNGAAKEPEETAKEELEEEKVGKEKKKKKGRIHEVRYMDHSANELRDVDADENDDELGGNKRRKGDKGIDQKRLLKVAKLKEQGGLMQNTEAVKKEDGAQLKKHKKDALLSWSGEVILKDKMMKKKRLAAE